MAKAPKPVKAVKAAKAPKAVKATKATKTAKPEKVKKSSSKAVAAKGLELADITKKKKKSKDTESTGVANPVQSMYMLRGQDESLIKDEGLSDFTARALRAYGSYVVEDRAIADFRDGLKPVHRAILWALSDLGLRPGGAFKKSARTVGDALGKYHPHGDAACYGAMTTIANTVPPAVAGQGNWGDPVTPAAAMRYTEAKMSKFTGLFLLDRDYMEVTPMVDNFSNDMKLPLYLPALLPYMLFNGGTPPPAYGVKCGNPSFSFNSVSKVIIDMLDGKEYDAKKLAKTLEIRHEFGCEDGSSASDMFDLINTGKGKITYRPLLKLDEKNKTIIVQSYVPGGFSKTESITKKLEKIAEITGVVRAANASGKKNKNCGPHGAAFEFKCRCSDEAFYEIAKKIEKEITSTINYNLGVTIRAAEGANAFKYLGYVQYFKAWISYRIKLEVRMLQNKMEKAAKQLHLNELYLWAVDNMKQLLAALPKILVAEDPDKTMSKMLKLPVEDAKIVLDRQVRKLAKLERADLVKTIKDLKAEIAGYKKSLKEPGKHAAEDTRRRVAQYVKSPDAKMAVSL